MVCLWSCGGAGADEQKEVKEFEGVITYRISYQGRDDTSVYGDTMRVYYSKGNIARIYNSEGPDALRKEIIYCKTLRYVAKKAMSDTVYTFNEREDGHLKSISIKRSSDDTRILGHVCRKIEFQDIHTGDISFSVYNSFMYADDVLKVDKRHFKDWNFAHFNTYINEAGAFYLKFESRYSILDRGLVTKICTAVNIKEQKVDSSVFYMDTTITKAMVL